MITDVLSKDQINSRIIQYVLDNPGCTDIQIVTKAGIVGDNFSLDLPVLLERLVNNGELIQVEFFTPRTIKNCLYYHKHVNLELLNENNKIVLCMQNTNRTITFPIDVKLKIIKN